jgi:hypothetical protein
MIARTAAKKDKQDNKSDLRGLTININSGVRSTPKELTEITFRSNSVHFIGDINLTLVNFIEEMCEKRSLSAK